VGGRALFFVRLRHRAGWLQGVVGLGYRAGQPPGRLVARADLHLDRVTRLDDGGTRRGPGEDDVARFERDQPGQVGDDVAEAEQHVPGRPGVLDQVPV